MGTKNLWLFSGISLLIFLTGAGCKEHSEDQKTDRDLPPASPAISQVYYPSIPDSTMQMLWEQCDFIDYIFYDLDFSMSQDQQTDIRNALKHISRATPVTDPACKPVGRIFFQVKGENAAEADIFLDSRCQYYLFYKNGEQAYANALTPQGVQFYEYVFSRVRGE